MPIEEGEAGISKLELCPRELLKRICFHDAVNCATALLEGETGIAIEFNAPSCVFYPLHRAARNLSVGLIELFLQHGARPSLCCHDDTFIFHKMDALTVALDAIANHEYFNDWNPKKSIIKLIYILCLLEMRVPLRNIQLLALNSEDEEVKVICSHIVREGRLIELAALLMVALKKLMTPVMVSGISVPMIEPCMIRQLHAVIDEEFKLMGCSSDGKLVRLCKLNKSVLLSASRMLNVFQKSDNIQIRAGE
ncbi:hypothetical protein ACH5RR_007990 [Cinchona calisaya]|uniref:Uncharacterized protein n=1 Tax=Cinchona calisaya TaxID=153742 RepID=A0ABD3ABX9_9GENT